MRRPARIRRARGLGWLLTCVIAQLAVLPPGWAQQHPSPTAPLADGGLDRPAMPFHLKTLDGQPVALDTFRGRLLIINFFASWCDPCREEMPLINELAARGARDGYSVLGIAVEDGRAAVTQYAREARLAFPVALDSSSAAKRAYGVFGPPATFFIDAQGTIRDAVNGPMTAERAELAIKRAAAVR